VSTVPSFSIIIPMYNRASIIRRTIESCLAQTDSDFELVVVDDGSSDDSAAIVASYADPRVRLLRHTRNRGPCPARNTAVAEARGDWCVMVDSDFELLRHALERLRARTCAVARDVGNVASSCEWDDGRVTPFPSVPTRCLDFPAYLRWVSLISVSEKLECIRRGVFAELRYPDSRAWELEFHLDLASRWKLELSDEVLVRIHADAPNRLTTGSGPEAVSRVLQDAPDKLASFENALRKHGEALQRWAPRFRDYIAALAAAQATYLGERARAFRHVGGVLRRRPLSAAGWAAAGLALLAPRVAAWTTVERRRWRA
jgi:glycosyltransferase involved in cell wall biosynthesis